MKAALGPLAIAIEHVGSTSVLCLPAKPILDLEIVIDSRDVLPAVTETLTAVGYRAPGRSGHRLRLGGEAGAMTLLEVRRSIQWRCFDVIGTKMRACAYARPDAGDDYLRFLKQFGVEDVVLSSGSHPDSERWFSAISMD